MGGVTTYYLYDGGQVIDEETQADPANPVVAAYGWGVDGLRARYSFPGSSAADLPADSSLAYLYDPSGNVSERLELLYNNDPAQTDGLYVQVRDYQIFDAFGLLSGRIDTVSFPSVPMDLDPVGFGGQYGYYTDQETGLVLLGARYYDPRTGRFLNRDPIGYAGGINLYGFCGNNPVNESDPSGDDPEDDPIPTSEGAVFKSAGKTFRADPMWKDASPQRTEFGNFVDSTPGVGTVTTAYTAVTGKSLIGGGKVSGWQRFLAIVSTVLIAAHLHSSATSAPTTPWIFNKAVDTDLRGTSTTLNDAVDLAFSKTGAARDEFVVTKWGKDIYGKSHPVEWRHPDGAEVNIDYPHTKQGPSLPHVGWQTGGKRGLGGAMRGHIILDDVPRGR